MDKKVIYMIMKTLCHDDEPSKPWLHGAVFCKIALNPDDSKRRYAWCVHIAGMGHSAELSSNTAIFADMCNSIVPTNEKKAKMQALARSEGQEEMEGPRRRA